MLERARRGGEAREARRDLAAEIAAEEEDDGLVERHPESDVGRERIGDGLGEPAEAVDAPGVLPAAGRPEPTRVRVVVQRDARLDSEPPQRRGPFTLERERGLREAPGLRLEDAALHGVAVRVDAERRQQREVGLPARAVPRGLAATRVALAEPAGALPLGPVVFRRALDLIGGGGDAPEEHEGGSIRYGSSVAWCFTQRASAMKMVSSQMLVARSPTRSRFLEIEMSSMQ